MTPVSGSLSQNTESFTIYLLLPIIFYYRQIIIGWRMNLVYQHIFLKTGIPFLRSPSIHPIKKKIVPGRGIKFIPLNSSLHPSF